VHYLELADRFCKLLKSVSFLLAHADDSCRQTRVNTQILWLIVLRKFCKTYQSTPNNTLNVFQGIISTQSRRLKIFLYYHSSQLSIRH